MGLLEIAQSVPEVSQRWEGVNQTRQVATAGNRALSLRSEAQLGVLLPLL